MGAQMRCRITVLESDGDGGWWLNFASPSRSIFQCTVETLRASISAGAREWFAQERAWWTADVAYLARLRQVLEGLDEALAATRNEDDSAGWVPTTHAEPARGAPSSRCRPSLRTSRPCSQWSGLANQCRTEGLGSDAPPGYGRRPTSNGPSQQRCTPRRTLGIRARTEWDRMKSADLLEHADLVRLGGESELTQHLRLGAEILAIGEHSGPNPSRRRCSSDLGDRLTGGQLSRAQRPYTPSGRSRLRWTALSQQRRPLSGCTR